MKDLTLILPNQLFPSHPALKKDREVVLIEHPRYFSAFRFHKQKLILHRASMKEYESTLRKRGYKVRYAEFGKGLSLSTFAKSLKAHKVYLADPLDEQIDKEVNALKKISKVELVRSPGFYLDRSSAIAYFENQKSYRMHYFYQRQRKEFGVLVDSNLKPKGGKWSYDTDNRKALPSSIDLPDLPSPNSHDSVREAKKYINKKFPKALGADELFFYPVTRRQALSSLTSFFDTRFQKFGDYQDAIHREHPTLFHSLLSSSLNIGLITPQEVVEKSISYAKDNDIPLNALEGFIRQILGWREFVLGVYLVAADKMKKENYFKAERDLPVQFYTGDTGLIPFDDTVKKSLTYSYAHHIERLMIAGNLFLLCEIQPMQVYRWFMELYIDAYDWVMVPNVLGMSQFADGGSMVTKPYISSSNYIRKMSNYKKGEWSDTWDGLYWRFVDKHKKKLAQNQRYTFVLKNLEKMSTSTLDQHKNHAEAFLTTL